MKYEPYYQKTRTPKPSLKKDCTTDILIIGGGIAGLSCAYHLQKSKHSVVLVDSGAIPSGASRNAAGMIVKNIEEDITDILAQNNGRAFYTFIEEAVDILLQFIKKNKIKCELRKLPTYFVAVKKRHEKQLWEEKQSRDTTGDPLQFIPSEDIQKKLCMKGTAATKETTYALNSVALCEEITKMLTCKIYENSSVKSIDLDKKRAYTHEGSISFDKVIITCQLPTLTTIEEWLVPINSYALMTQPLNFSEAFSFYNTELPAYAYGIVLDNKRMLFGGVDVLVDADKKSLKENIELLKKDMERNLIIPAEPTHGWGHKIEISLDGVPFAGEWQKDIFISRGVMGIPVGFATGKEVAALILGKKSKYKTLLNPRRTFSIKQRIEKKLIHNSLVTRFVNCGMRILERF